MVEVVIITDVPTNQIISEVNSLVNGVPAIVVCCNGPLADVTKNDDVDDCDVLDKALFPTNTVFDSTLVVDNLAVSVVVNISDMVPA